MSRTATGGATRAGEAHGFLTAVAYAGSDGKRCACGAEKTYRVDLVRAGRRVSCGGKWHHHGNSHTRLYAVWNTMKQRCQNPRAQAYGIRVCDAWQSFEGFCADMEPDPGAGFSLEREDNNGNYEPGNVRWATAKEQAANRTNNRLLTFLGHTAHFQWWAEAFGVTRKTLRSRLAAGYDLGSALTLPRARYGGQMSDAEYQRA